MGNKKIEKDCFEFLRKSKHSIVNLRTGFGKSKIIHDFVESFSNKNVVIAVPKSIVLQWRKYFDSSSNNISVITFSLAALKTNKRLLRRADFIIIDEPKFLKGRTQAWEFLVGGKFRCAKKILLDATIIENKLEEIDYIRAWFDGISRKEFMKTIFHRKVKMPRNVLKKIFRVVLPDAAKLRLMYGEFLLLQALKDKKKFLIYKYLMENVRKLSSVEKPKDVGWFKVSALDEIVNRKDAGRGIIFSNSRAMVTACVEKLRKLGKRVEEITGDTKQADRELIRDRFNNFNIDWIVGTRAVERGLDLPSGRCVVNVDIPFSGSSLVQRDRVTRRVSYGVKTTTFFTILIDDSVEELQLAIANAKIKADKKLKKGVMEVVDKPKWTEFMEELVSRRKKLWRTLRKRKK